MSAKGVLELLIHSAVREVSNVKTSAHNSSSFSAPAKNSPSNERSVLGAQFNDSPPHVAEADDSTRVMADRVLTTGLKNLSDPPWGASGADSTRPKSERVHSHFWMSETTSSAARRATETFVINAKPWTRSGYSTYRHRTPAASSRSA